MVYTPGSGGRVEVVVPANVSVSVSIARASGGALTVYSDAARTASVAMPATATGTSTFYLADDDLYTLGATVSGVQCASFGGTVGAATLYIRGDTTLTLNTDRETAETAGANAAFAPITGSAAYVPPAGKTTTGASAPLPFYNVRDYGADPTGSASSDTAFAALLALASPAAPIEIYWPAGSYKLNNAYTIDPTAVVLTGVTGKTVWNCAGFAGTGTGPAGVSWQFSVYATAGIYYTEHQWIHGISLIGGSTYNGIAYGGGAGSSSPGSGYWAPFLTTSHVTMSGFGQQLIWGQNTWCHKYIQCNWGAWITAWASFPSCNNAGEAMQFYGCVRHGPQETLICNQPDSGFFHFGCSDDGTGRYLNATNGYHEYNSCWIEGTDSSMPSGANEVFLLNHSGSEPPALILDTPTIVPRWAGVQALITVTGSGLAKIHVTDPIVYTSSDASYGPTSGVFIQDIGSSPSEVIVTRPMWIGPKSLTVPVTARTDFKLQPHGNPGITNLYGATGGEWLGTTTSGAPTGTGPFFPGQWTNSASGIININVGNTRSVSDAVLNGTTTLTSATAAFTGADTGRTITGIGIPFGTTMTLVNSTTVTLSQAATVTASGVTIVIYQPNFATIAFLSSNTPAAVGQNLAGAAGQASSSAHRHAMYTWAGLKTSAYTAAAGDYVATNSTTAAFTVTAPPVGVGVTFAVYKVDSSANAVTVSFGGTNVYEGATTTTLTTQFQVKGFICDGTNWYPLP